MSSSFPSSSFTSSTTLSSSSSLSLPSSSTLPGPGNGNPGGDNGGDNGGGGFNSGGNPGGSSIASSASLYLYTFLATLVLLLSVSAAIVVRSFLLRRRHRRMIEEAIRNGTWIPPTPGGRGGPKVDLSKKPVMWEAYLDFHHQCQNQQQNLIMEDRDWEYIKPFMATYLTDKVVKKPGNALGGGGGGTGEGGVGDSNGNSGAVNMSRGFMGMLSRRARGVLRTSPPVPVLPLANSTGAADPTRHGSTLNVSSSAGQDVPMSEITPPEPPRVRVAVLIAMPRPHNTSTSSLHSSPSSSTSTSSSSPPSAERISPNLNVMHSEEEEELPHIEMGIVDLRVSDADTQLVTGDLHHVGKGKTRESMASTSSA